MKILQASTFAALGPSLAVGYLYGVPINTQYGAVERFKYFNSSTSSKYFNISDSHIAAFLGVPYAANTAYENRWKPAQPRERWNGTLKASKSGPACPIAHQAPTYNLSEDCLSANIWTPAKNASAKLPVMVWNYGSGETSAEPLYDGGGLAIKDVVVVSYNYRDVAFGFLAHPDLSEESYERNGYNASGNYGVMDFVTCLEWVRDNIANFGGDPEHVVIAGQSFGSAQVYHAVNSPLAKGLFKGMIAESGIRYPYDPLLAGLADSYKVLKGPDGAEALGVNYTLQHNVSTIAELRTLSMDDLLVGSDDRDDSLGPITYQWMMYPPLYKTSLDGYVVPSTYEDELLSGPANDVPMITGNNRDESGAATNINYTVAQYDYYTSQFYGNLTSTYRELYPANNSTQADLNWNAASRDSSLISSYLFANAWVHSPAKSPFYTYYWDYAPPGQSGGAHHMAEINYVLRKLCGTNLPWGPYDYYLADVMSSYWANFVKTLDPNLGGSFKKGNLTTWSPNAVSTAENASVMHVGTGFGYVPVAPPENIDFFTEWYHQHIPY